MSIDQPGGPVYPARTPTYDETVAESASPPFPPYEPVYEPVVDSSDSAHSASSPSAKAQAGEAAGRAKDTVADAAGDVKDEAAGVASAASDAGQQVASATKEQAEQVVMETMAQARNLFGQATTELSSQASKQQEQLGRGLRTFGTDLAKMGDRADAGLAVELVQNLADRAHSVADWLEARSPEDVLHEARQYAARRPGMFIAFAAVTGIVAARLTKALTADTKAPDAAPRPADGSTYLSGAAEPERIYPPAPTGYDESGAAYVAPDTYDVAENEYGSPVLPGTGRIGGRR
jgi:uncharacterized protein YjbJ (UPF0337 family)